MPHTKSAAKHLRTDDERRVRHKAKRNELKTIEKKFREAVAAGVEKSELQKLLSSICSKLDKATKDRTILKNKSSRKKSQMMGLLNKKQDAAKA